ncbi:hypothetical protein L6452_14083 [Arctium lappa]|uniref:Uncharacterized protein n=1 Tax=Arctium lappa TaxID=4217 RepID=A0ACB9CK29_ARCLA|nr:hypothetical protein L6452_14083 [Arctium lappa]
MSDAIYDKYHSQNHFLDTHDDVWYAGRTVLLATLSSYSSHSYEIPADTPTAGGCTSLDLNVFSRMLRIQPESNEQFTYTPYTTMPEPTRTQVHVENQPEDFLDALFVLETRFTTLYEQDKLGHEMTKAMYKWHLNKNYLTEKGPVIFSKL